MKFMYYCSYDTIKNLENKCDDTWRWHKNMPTTFCHCLIYKDIFKTLGHSDIICSNDSIYCMHYIPNFKIMWLTRKTRISCQFLAFFSFLLLQNSKYMWAMYMKLSETIEAVYVSAYFKFQTSISFFLSATWS